MSRPIPTKELTILDIEMKFVRHKMVGECLEMYKYAVYSNESDIAAGITLSNGTHHGYRVIYQLCYGEIPDGLDVDHVCENRACIRPSHLQAITHLWNMNLIRIRNELRRRGEAPPKRLRQNKESGRGSSSEPRL